jgi:hypothetical protein
VAFTRGDAAATDTTAALVPADALVYVHLSTADSRTQDTRLREVAGRFSNVANGIPRLGGAPTPPPAPPGQAHPPRPGGFHY